MKIIVVRSASGIMKEIAVAQPWTSPLCLYCSKELTGAVSNSVIFRKAVHSSCREKVKRFFEQRVAMKKK